MACEYLVLEATEEECDNVYDAKIALFSRRIHSLFKEEHNEHSSCQAVTLSTG